MENLMWVITNYLDNLVATSQLPGYAISMSQGGQQLSAFGGTTNNVLKKRPESDTYFAVYSITKAATALAALRLAQRDCLNLYLPVTTYLDGWVDAAPNASNRPVRVIHLLSHTAGFTYGSRRGPIGEAYRRAGFIRGAPRSLAGRELYSHFSRLPRLYAPGCGWSYSLASDVLGWVVSEASMSPLSEVLRREVFDPLGMTRTCLFTELQKNHDVAIVYEHCQHGWRPAISTMVQWADAGAPQSGGSSMVTTLRDIMRLASAYIEAGQDFLSADLWKLTETNFIPNRGSLRTGVLSPLAGRAIDGVGYAAGVAIVVNGEATGIPESLGEVGWEGSTGCFFFANRRLGLSTALMTNVYKNPHMPWWIRLRHYMYSNYPFGSTLKHNFSDYD